MGDDSQEGLRYRESSQHFAVSSTARQGHKMGLFLWKINGKKALHSCAQVFETSVQLRPSRSYKSLRKRRYRAGWQGRRSMILTNHPPIPHHLHGSLLDLFTPVNTFFASRGAWSQTQCHVVKQLHLAKGEQSFPLTSWLCFCSAHPSCSWSLPPGHRTGTCSGVQHSPQSPRPPSRASRQLSSLQRVLSSQEQDLMTFKIPCRLLNWKSMYSACNY